MIIDSLYHGETLLEATRAELYERGSVRRYRHIGVCAYD